MKKRISITLDEKILKKVDELVNGLRIRSRSDAIEKLLERQIGKRKYAVILAGGNPERLIIKGTKIFRPLVKIKNFYLIEDIVLKCRDAGFENVLIPGFPSILSKIYEVLGDGRKYNVRITYVEEERELGSAKTLELTKDYIESDFLLLPCDQWMDFDLKEFYDFHLAMGGIATLAIHTRTTFDWKMGVVSLKGYRIVEYDEMPRTPKTRLVSTFTCFMKPEIFEYIPPGNVKWSLQENVFPRLAKEGKLIGYPILGNWVNVHSLKDVEKVKSLL